MIRETGLMQPIYPVPALNKSSINHYLRNYNPQMPQITREADETSLRTVDQEECGWGHVT